MKMKKKKKKINKKLLPPDDIDKNHTECKLYIYMRERERKREREREKKSGCYSVQNQYSPNRQISNSLMSVDVYCCTNHANARKIDYVK